MIKEVAVTLIFILDILILILLVTKKQYIKQKIFGIKFSFETYCVGVIVGPILLLAFKLLSFSEIGLALTKSSSSNPLGILALFLSMALLSIYLDAAGVIEYCARYSLKFSGNSGTKLFLCFYALVSVLTMFTSNDIIILTLTPFIYYFAKYADIDPKPFLFAEFFAANTWSMILQIGNPTNIYITSVYGMNFLTYLKWMFLPSLIGGIVNLIVLYLLFKKSINKKINLSCPNPREAIKDNFGAWLGFILLSLCLISLALGPYIGIEMWKISLVFAVVLIVIQLVREILIRYKLLPKSLLSLKQVWFKIPWSVVPFVLSFFIIVHALEVYGIIKIVGDYFASLVSSATGNIFLYGFSSAFAANVMNNIPMSVAFSSIMSGLSGANLNAAILATVIGSNLGALITPIGALAGIMWMSILKGKKYKINFSEFVYYGAIAAFFTLLATLVVLMVEFWWM